jgi:hypothetical protein
VKYIKQPLKNFYKFFLEKERRSEKMRYIHTIETRKIMRKIQMAKQAQIRLRRRWINWDIKIMALKYQIENKLMELRQ